MSEGEQFQELRNSPRARSENSNTGLIVLKLTIELMRPCTVEFESLYKIELIVMINGLRCADLCFTRCATSRAWRQNERKILHLLRQD